MRIRKKRRVHKNVFDGRGELLRHLWKGHVMDIDEPQVNDSWYIEGTICLVNEWMSAKAMVFQAWVHKRAPLNSQWLVLRIGGANFLHCWVTDSM